MKLIHCGWIVLLGIVVAAPVHAQRPAPLGGLDSGTVARLTWQPGDREQVLLLSRLSPASDSVHYCHYPSSGCGLGSVNPVRARALRELAQVEIRHGNHALRGALWGAAAGVFVGALALSLDGLSDSPVSTGTQVAQFTISLVSTAVFGALLGSGGHDWAPAR